MSGNNFFEVLIMILPEIFMINFVTYTLARESIDRNKYITVSVIMSDVIFIVRLLPIYFGIHNIINIILCISIMTIMGIPLIKSIKNTLTAFLVLQMSEFLNIVVFALFEIEILACENMSLKILYELPTLIFFIIVSLIFKYRGK